VSIGKNEANRDKREPRLEIGMDGALKKENPSPNYGREGFSIGSKDFLSKPESLLKVLLDKHCN